MASSSSSSSSTSPSHILSSEKKHWWLTTKKMVEKLIREARVMISTREETEINSALSQLEAALALSPRCEDALELKSRCLLNLRRYKEVADMLQDYIPSYKTTVYSDDSSASSSDNSSQNIKLLGSSELNSGSGCDYSAFKCFSVSDLKKRVLAGISRNSDKEGQWRYIVLGQACCHLGLMEDALVLLQHGKRLATAAHRRESICWSDDSFSFSVSSSETAVSHQPLSEAETTTHLISHIKVLLRRRAAALAALEAGLYSESVRHFSKIVDGRRPAPQAFLAECYLHRSAAFKAAGRVAESIADLNRTLALDQNSTSALLARAGLFEMIGCITDSVHDLEHVKLIYNSILRDRKHVKLIYNSILRDRKPPGPCWKPRAVSYREIPGQLCNLGSKIQQLKQRIAMGETRKVDYYGLIGLRRGCSRPELDRAHLLLVLKHKPEKSIGFLERCEFADESDFDSIKDRARMSAVLLFRLIQKGYSSLSTDIAEAAAVERERSKAALALQQAQAQAQAQAQLERETQNIIQALKPEPEPCIMSSTGVGAFPFQGVFCRDLAVVGSLLSQAGFDRPLTVKYEALTC